MSSRRAGELASAAYDIVDECLSTQQCGRWLKRTALVRRRRDSILPTISEVCRSLVIAESVVLRDKESIDTVFDLASMLPVGMTLRSLDFQLNDTMVAHDGPYTAVWLEHSKLEHINKRFRERFTLNLIRGVLRGELVLRMRTPLRPRSLNPINGMPAVPAPLPWVPMETLMIRCLRMVPRLRCSFEATATPDANHESVNTVWRWVQNTGAQLGTDGDDGHGRAIPTITRGA
jgi:hypothetical protein